MTDESEIKIQSDLFRYVGNVSRKSFYYNFLHNSGFRYSYFLRKCQRAKGVSWLKRKFWSFLLRRTELKYHIHMNPSTKIGYGLFIGYGECVTIGSLAVIGNNLTINHGAVIGGSGRGKRMGFPVIGDNVYIGANAVVVGKITIGDNVLIAPLAHVNFDVPDNAVVAGNRGEIISLNGTEGYVTNKWEF
jgi:serine O-acetyltransferase